MLSRKTRSQIIELIETVRGGLVCQNTKERAAMLDECIAALSVSYEIIQKELSHERLAQYDDTIATVKTAMMQLKENPDSEEIAALSLQLIDWLLGQLRNEHVKKEIVFLPYKASMWDSLESIWKAAYEDKEHCNTYVIPIPYADLVRDEQGQLTVHSWHCEIDEMPDYVPVIDNETVSLEEMHPDVIFIHNPYDNTNYVTSVDMRYYSSELKKYTDKLIYIPYFVVGKNLPKHLAEAPGILNADYVIVESEEVKEEYERYYPGGNPPDGKFIALGSPKFDKVLSTKRENYILPEKWKKLLKGKKAVFYNTGISTVLENREVYLKKIRSVFELFRNREDIVLWWRPHPLLEATFDSIIPDQADEYRKIKGEYIQAGWGIYDDSPELERAIAWTDAYYGDASSVVWMYRKTGKKIWLQNIKSCNNFTHFTTEYIWADDDIIWFIPTGLGVVSLFSYDMGKKQLKCHWSDSFPSESEYDYAPLAKLDNQIVIAPYTSGKFFLVYDLEKKSLVKIEIMNPYGKVINSEHIKFGDVVKHKNTLIFIGCSTPIFACYERKERKFYYFDFREKLQGVNWIIERGSAVVANGLVYMIISGTNCIAVFDVNTMELTIKELPIEIIGEYLGYDRLEQTICVFCARKSRMVSWNPETNEIKQMIDESIDDDKYDYPYHRPIVIGSTICLLPYEGDTYSFWDKISTSVNKLASHGDSYSIVQFDSDRNCAYAFDNKHGMIIKILDNMEFEKHKLYVEKTPKDITKSRIMNDNYFDLDMVQSATENTAMGLGIVGEKIYKYVMK